MNTDEVPLRSSDRVPRYPMANPDDPLVHHLPQGPHGPRPEPYSPSLPGRGAVVEGQVFVVAFIFIAQLWLVTEALYELLSGQTHALKWIALASLIGFVIALVVWRWPQYRLEN